MRQTLLVVTCDKCGIQHTFETLNVNANGPIMATLDPIEQLERRGWTCLRQGLRQIDICKECAEQGD